MKLTALLAPALVALPLLLSAPALAVEERQQQVDDVVGGHRLNLPLQSEELQRRTNYNIQGLNMREETINSKRD